MTDSLTATTSSEGTTMVVRWDGSAEGDAFEPLQALLAGIHDQLVASHARDVIADLGGLEFATSSCLKAFATWLARVQDLAAPDRYTIRFRPNPTYSWQARSLPALQAFAGEVMQIMA